VPRHPTLLALIPALTLAALLPAACGGGGAGPAPAVCGDGLVQAGEACDGAALDGQSCVTLGLGFAGGTLACGPGCTFVTTGCTRPAVCGDGVAQPGEACDDADLAGQTCASLGLGFVGGTLTCSGRCTFVTSACERGAARCGDGQVQAGEACDDGNDVGGDGCSPACQLEAPSSGWFAPGGAISEGGEP